MILHCKILIIWIHKNIFKLKNCHSCFFKFAFTRFNLLKKMSMLDVPILLTFFSLISHTRFTATLRTIKKLLYVFTDYDHLSLASHSFLFSFSVKKRKRHFLSNPIETENLWLDMSRFRM